MKQQPEQSKRPETGQISAKLECLERGQKNYVATHKPERERRKNKHQRAKTTPNALPPAPVPCEPTRTCHAPPKPMQNEATGKKKMRPRSFDLETSGLRAHPHRTNQMSQETFSYG